MSQSIFVCGATGTTGNRTVRSLLSSGAKVVAGVHSPEKAGALEDLGATVRPFDLDNVAGMSAAMRGCEGLYLVTPVSEQTQLLTKATVDAAKAAGIKRVVKLSGLNVDQLQNIALARWHLAAEHEIVTSGLQWTFLRANSFIQNLLGAAHSIKSQGLYYNTYGSALVSLVDARDIGDVAATILLSTQHASQSYKLTGPRGLGSRDIVQMLSKATGKTISSTDLNGEPLAQALFGMGLTRAIATATAELLDHMATGAASDVSSDVQTLLGRPARDLQQWLDHNAGAFE